MRTSTAPQRCDHIKVQRVQSELGPHQGPASSRAATSRPVPQTPTTVRRQTLRLARSWDPRLPTPGMCKRPLPRSRIARRSPIRRMKLDAKPPMRRIRLKVWGRFLPRKSSPLRQPRLHTRFVHARRSTPICRKWCGSIRRHHVMTSDPTAKRFWTLSESLRLPYGKTVQERKTNPLTVRCFVTFSCEKDMTTQMPLPSWKRARHS